MHLISRSYFSGFAGSAFGLLLIALLGYLTFAAMQGEHGLFRLFQIEAQEKRLLVELEELRSERRRIGNKVERLSAESLDLELLDEQARKVLGLARTDEILIR